MLVTNMLLIQWDVQDSILSVRVHTYRDSSDSCFITSAYAHVQVTTCFITSAPVRNEPRGAILFSKSFSSLKINSEA